jgi:hypothetical protein
MVEELTGQTTEK